MTQPISTSLTARFSESAGGAARAPLRVQFGPYEGTGVKDVQVYPAAGASVFVTSGTLEARGSRVETVTAAAIFTGGDTASVQFPIVSLLSAELITGQVEASDTVSNDTPFFNIDNPTNWINIDDPESIGWFNLDGRRSGGFALQKPSVTAGSLPPELKVENYTLKLDKPFFGAYLITYQTSYQEYRWYHGAPESPHIDFVGMAVATMPSGEAATLTLTARNAGSPKPARSETPNTPPVVVVRQRNAQLYRVVSEYVVDPVGQWEKPPGFPEETWDEGPDPDIHMTNLRVHEIGYVDKFGVVREEDFHVYWLMPFRGKEWEPEYKLEWMPPPDDTWNRAWERIAASRILAGIRERYKGIEV